MAFWYNNRRIDYHKFNNLKSEDMVERILTRLYGICFGREEYQDDGFKIVKGIVVRLINDESMDILWDIDINLDEKTIILKKNPSKTNNLNWFSFVSNNIEIRKSLKDKIDLLLK